MHCMENLQTVLPGKFIIRSPDKTYKTGTKSMGEGELNFPLCYFPN